MIRYNNSGKETEKIKEIKEIKEIKRNKKTIINNL